MGCDIHLFVEVRIDGLWCSRGGVCEVVDPGRNYLLFAHLAGVRNNGMGIMPLAHPRGLPDDLASEAEKYLDPSSGLHSYSWFTLVELMRHHWTGPTVHTSFGPGDLGFLFEPLLALALREGVPPADIRIVFGFDN